jgi:hypothetical protein
MITEIRGCSTWASSEDNLGQSGGYKCHDVDMNGLQHESCKGYIYFVFDQIIIKIHFSYFQFKLVLKLSF